MLTRYGLAKLEKKPVATPGGKVSTRGKMVPIMMGKLTTNFLKNSPGSTSNCTVKRKSNWIIKEYTGANISLKYLKFIGYINELSTSKRWWRYFRRNGDFIVAPTVWAFKDWSFLFTQSLFKFLCGLLATISDGLMKYWHCHLWTWIWFFHESEVYLN